MSEIVADPLSSSCYHLFPEFEIKSFQRPGPDFCLPHARERVARSGVSQNPAAWPPQPSREFAADSLQISGRRRTWPDTVTA